MTNRRNAPKTLSLTLFTMFWVAQAVSLFGDRLHNFSLVALVNRFAIHPGVTLPNIYLAMYLPIFSLAPLIGALVDRLERRWILVVTDVLRGALVAVIPPLFMRTGSFLPIMGVVFLLSTGNLFFAPAKSALIPELVPADRLIRVNAILWSAGIVGMIGGFLGGGLIFDYVSWQACFYIDGATYAFSALLLTGIALRHRARRTTVRTLHPGILVSIREGLTAIRRSAMIRQPIGVQSLIFFSAGGFSVPAVVLIRDTCPPGTLGLGIAGVSLGLGMGIGSILANRVSEEHRMRFKCGMFVLLAPAAAVFASHRGYYAIGAGSFCAGLASAPLFIIAESELQRRIGGRLRGIVFSFREILTRSLFVGAAFLLGTLSKYIHKGMLLTALGLFLATIGVIWLLVTERSIREIKKSTGGRDGDN